MNWKDIYGYIEYWKNIKYIQGYIVYPDYLLMKEVASQFDGDFSVLEIGSLYGKSSVAWASLGGNVHCLDSWAEDAHTDNTDCNIVYNKFLENTKEYNITHTKISHVHPMTEDIFYDVGDYDVVFYDACHSKKSTYNMIQYWKHKTKFLVLDDLQMQDVSDAIKDSGIKLNTRIFSKMGYTKGSSE